MEESIEQVKISFFNKLDKLLENSLPKEDEESNIITTITADGTTGDVNAEITSIKELASWYSQERQHTLKNVVSNTLSRQRADESVGNSSVQQQIRIWADVAMDLDTYYLTMLNKNFRLERTNEKNIGQSMLLSKSVSESVIDDIRKIRNKQMFMSQEDVHDDVILGQLNGSYGVGERSVNDLIESLLEKTNKKRQATIEALEQTAEHRRESIESPVEKSELGKKIYSIYHDNEGKFVENDDVVEVEMNQLWALVERYRVYVGDLQDELQNRKAIIEQLKGENIEMINVFDTFDRYMTHSNEKSAEKLEKMKYDYQAEIDAKNSEIKQLKSEIAEIQKDRKSFDTKDDSISKRREFGLTAIIESFEKHFQKVFMNVRKFAKAVDESKLSFRDVHTEGEKVNAQSCQRDLDDEDEFSPAEHVVELIDPSNCSWCTKFSKYGKEYDRSYLEITRNVLGGSMTSLCKELNKIIHLIEELDGVLRGQVNVNNDGIVSEDIKNMKKLLKRIKWKIEKAAVFEKGARGEEILQRKHGARPGVRKSIKKEVMKALEEKQCLEKRLERALEDLANAQNELEITNEEMKQLTAIDEGKTIENELLMKYILQGTRNEDIYASKPLSYPSMKYWIS